MTIPKRGFDDHICLFYPELDDEKLLKLFYAFDENRTFRDLEGKSYKTLEEVGLLFAKNIEFYTNDKMKAEKDYFLNFCNHKEYIGLSWDDLLFELFKSKVLPEIELSQTIISEDKNIIKYKCRKTLTEFFLSKHINVKVKYGENETFSYEFNNSNLKINKLVSVFFLDLEGRHNINQASLTKSNRQQFIRELKRQLKTERAFYKTRKYFEKLQNNKKIIAGILGFGVFLYFAVNWGDTAQWIYHGLHGDWNVGKLGDALMGKEGSFRWVIMFLPAIIIVILSGIIRFMWLVAIYIFGYSFPLIAGSIAYTISYLGILQILKNKKNYMNIWYAKAMIYVFILVIATLGIMVVNKADSRLIPSLITFVITSVESKSNVPSRYRQNSKNKADGERDVTSQIQRTPSRLEKQTPSIHCFTIDVSAANMRSGPSTRYRVVDVIRKNEQFEIVSSSNGWSKIRFKGKEGYVSNRLIRTEK